MHVSVSDEVLIGTTLFLGVVAIFGPAWADQFKAWWLSPELKLEVRTAPPDCHMTEMVWNWGSANVFKDKAFVYRVRVSNAGKSQARKCEVVMEGLAIEDASGGYIPHPTFTPVRLIWGGGYTDFVDINPSRHFFCDLFKVPAVRLQKTSYDLGKYVDLAGKPSPKVGLVLDVESVFFSQPNRLPDGKYRLDLTVYSENCGAVRQPVYVAWSGHWKESQEEMFRECVIRSAPAI